jgi:hypothetical protein
VGGFLSIVERNLLEEVLGQVSVRSIREKVA